MTDTATGRHARRRHGEPYATDGAHDGSGTADPNHLQSDAMPPSGTRSRTTQESDGKSQRNHAGGRKHGRHRSPEVVPNDDAQRDIVLGKPVVRSTTPIPVSGLTLDGSGRSRFRLHRGDRLVLTGTMNRSRDEWIYLLEGLGLVIWPTVTMQVRLVVAADIDSESTKARKARDYGIPIVDEDWLERALRNGLVEE